MRTVGLARGGKLWCETGANRRMGSPSSHFRQARALGEEDFTPDLAEIAPFVAEQDL
jgi:hypothetical protein